jgi:glycosyltransferase XagB
VKARIPAVVGALVAVALWALSGAAPAHAGSDVGWSAGPVAQGTGYARPGGSQRVREVQRTLRALHLRPGPVDGLFGPRTTAAVLRFQTADGLPADAVVGPRTLRRLRAVEGPRQRPATTPAHRPRTKAPAEPPQSPAPAEPPRTSAPAAPAPAEPGPGVMIMVALLGVLTALIGLLVFAGALATRRANDGGAAVSGGAADQLALPAGPAVAEPAPTVTARRSRLGERLVRDGALSRSELTAALAEQRRSGGRLGEILVASGTVAVRHVTKAMGGQLRMATLEADDRPVGVLDVDRARALRAVALNGVPRNGDAIAVAVADPHAATPAELEAALGRPVTLRLTDEATLDDLMRRVYADADADEVTRTLREEVPELSAYRTMLSKPQGLLACVLVFVIAVGLLADLALTATVLVGIATAFFVASTVFRLYAAWAGCRPGATLDPSAAELQALDGRALPVYTILLPLYKEKPGTVRALFEALRRLDYPKHKLDGLLLIEDDDEQTRAAIEKVGRPPWMRSLRLPPGVPRTKPRAMGIGLRYARGSLVTVYDAEDKPDPMQLKKAAWGFARVGGSVACLQAKLGYYNPRQNLLTRWFTLEYDAWFNIFLPGLHRIGAPIPLGGTSNHFRRGALEACLGWDPYNVTEDADLGLRFARLGLTTAMLESTTGEEANSQLANWIRQRSRWSKGYMQTLLVHTRRPLRLLRQLGPRATIGFLLTIGGAVVTALLAPIFWGMLLVWLYLQPAWIADLFPGPIYYAASICLVAGNFLLIFLSLCAAVGRGHDDLAPHALLTPFYWVLMSAATYMALAELIFRPHYWHKTEHGLHLAEEPT